MAAEPTGNALAHDAASASLRVIESAVALARAEAKLVVVRARTLFTAALVVALGVVVAISFAQLTLILLTLSPLFVAPGTPWGPEPLFISLGIAICLVLVGGGVAWWGFRRLGQRALEGQDGGEA